jgi:hypothetical protein
MVCQDQKEDAMSGGWPANTSFDALYGDQAAHGLGNLLPQLATDFPGYDFATQRTWNGVALVAVCREGAEQSGTCVIITSDPGEMRHTLASEGTQPSHR